MYRSAPFTRQTLIYGEIRKEYPSIKMIIPQKQQSIQHKAALAYVKLLGWAIFPTKGKRPLTPRGFYDATRDINKINEYWQQCPDAGIGLPTGKLNDVIVIDIDPRNYGDYSFERLIEENEEFPNTVESFTGGGGTHYFFKYDESITKSKLKDYRGIDIQGDGKYVVLPPSIHPNGKSYEWEQSSKPVKTKIAEMPDWLKKKLQETRGSDYSPRPVDDYLNILEGVNEGERNNSMMTLIGHLLAKRVDYRIAYELVKLWNERNNPPLSDREITTAFNNILRKELSKAKQHRG